MSGLDASDRLVITADTRRRWSAGEKRAIVEEAAQSTTSVSRVARRHGIAPSLVFRWRREFAEADRAHELPSGSAFIPIALPAPADAPARHDWRSGMIEIELISGRRMRVDGTVDIAVLKRIVDALEGR